MNFLTPTGAQGVTICLRSVKALIAYYVGQSEPKKLHLVSCEGTALQINVCLFVPLLSR